MLWSRKMQHVLLQLRRWLSKGLEERERAMRNRAGPISMKNVHIGTGYFSQNKDAVIQSITPFR